MSIGPARENSLASRNAHATKGPIRTRSVRGRNRYGKDVVGLTWSAIHQRSLSLTLNSERSVKSRHNLSTVPIAHWQVSASWLGRTYTNPRTLIRLTQGLPGQIRELPPKKMMASSPDILRSQAVEATSIRRARWECAHLYARGGC